MSIFINYRKDDSRWNTQALYNGLLNYFPKETIFKDFNNIQPGEDFFDSISSALGQCKVLLVVISKNWLTATDAEGNNRLEDPNDFVRIEIATALKRRIRVIPVLFDNMEMPKPGALPEDLQALTRRQYISISDTRFDTDLQRLAEAIKRKEDEGTTLLPIEFESETDDEKAKTPHRPTTRERVIAALIAWLVASAIPMSLLIFVPIKPKEEHEILYTSWSEMLLFSLGAGGGLWALIGALVGKNRKSWAFITIGCILTMIALINSYNFREDHFEAIYAAIGLICMALVNLFILFLIWLYQKIAR